MKTLDLNKNYTAVIDDDGHVEIVSDTTRVIFYPQRTPEKGDNVKVIASHVGSKIKSVNESHDEPFAPFVLIEVVEG